MNETWTEPSGKLKWPPKDVAIATAIFFTIIRLYMSFVTHPHLYVEGFHIHHVFYGMILLAGAYHYREKFEDHLSVRLLMALGLAIVMDGAIYFL